jgi:hypothetical protein
MSRKDYSAIADALAGIRPLLNDPAYHQWRSVVKTLAHMCHKDNARFDAAKFFTACHVEKED